MQARPGGSGRLGDLRIVAEQLMQSADGADAAPNAIQHEETHGLRHSASVEGHSDDQPVQPLRQPAQGVLEGGETGELAHPTVEHLPGIAAGVAIVDDAEQAES